MARRRPDRDSHWRRSPTQLPPRVVLSYTQIAREAAITWRRRRRLPATLADCPTTRPCPYVTCRYHLAYEVTGNGSIQQTWPGRDIDDIPGTCALDYCSRGGMTIDEIGAIMNVSYERVRQIEVQALAKIRAALGVDYEQPKLRQGRGERWTPQEDDLLRRLYRRHGNDYRAIAAEWPARGRSVKAVETRVGKLGLRYDRETDPRQDR